MSALFLLALWDVYVRLGSVKMFIIIIIILHFILNQRESTEQLTARKSTMRLNVLSVYNERLESSLSFVQNCVCVCLIKYIYYIYMHEFC